MKKNSKGLAYTYGDEEHSYPDLKQGDWVHVPGRLDVSLGRLGVSLGQVLVLGNSLFEVALYANREDAYPFETALLFGSHLRKLDDIELLVMWTKERKKEAP